ncbi:MAG TPA: hypothetical protein VFS76_06155 [Pyrinomonadaceae bacterium]|nr:hypothetical protein [Pyrinomonadaceae bacterium]
MQVSLRNTAIASIVFVLWTNLFAVPTNTLPERVSREEKPSTSLSNHPDAQDPMPSGWQKIDAYGKFTFNLPAGMRNTGIVGIENLHGEFSNRRLHLSYDYKPFDHLAYDRREKAMGKNFQETELLIDGKKSFLFVWQEIDSRNRLYYNVDLYVGDLPKSQVLMRMWTRSRSAKDVELSKAIFQTIRFAS